MTDTTAPAGAIPDRIDCKHCKGTGKTHHAAWTALSGRHYPARTDDCYKCDGDGYFTNPDFDAKELGAAIFSTRKKGALVSKRPKDDRAYYIWRMIRFHTGADVTLPMTASICVSGDPYVPRLDAIAELISERMTGRKSSGRARWRSTMLGEESGPGLAASAYSGGPVVLDSDKPWSEQLELR